MKKQKMSTIKSLVVLAGGALAGSAGALILGTKEPAVLKQGDAVEVQIGQGAFGSVGHYIKPEMMDLKLSQQMGLQMGQKAVIHARQK